MPDHALDLRHENILQAGNTVLVPPPSTIACIAEEIEGVRKIFPVEVWREPKNPLPLPEWSLLILVFRLQQNLFQATISS